MIASSRSFGCVTPRKPPLCGLLKRVIPASRNSLKNITQVGSKISLVIQLYRGKKTTSSFVSPTGSFDVVSLVIPLVSNRRKMSGRSNSLSFASRNSFSKKFVMSKRIWAIASRRIRRINVHSKLFDFHNKPEFLISFS